MKLAISSVTPTLPKADGLWGIPRYGRQNLVTFLHFWGSFWAMVKSQPSLSNTDSVCAEESIYFASWTNGSFRKYTSTNIPFPQNCRLPKTLHLLWITCFKDPFKITFCSRRSPRYLSEPFPSVSWQVQPWYIFLSGGPKRWTFTPWAAPSVTGPPGMTRTTKEQRLQVLNSVAVSDSGQ